MTGTSDVDSKSGYSHFSQAPPAEPLLLRTVDLHLGPERLGVRARSGRTERIDNDIHRRGDGQF